MAHRFDSPVQYVKGVGPKRAAVLETAGIRTAGDLLCHLPRRYEDRSRFLPISGLRQGVPVTVRGKVLEARLQKTRRRNFTIFHALVGDDSGAVPCLFFNQPYLQDVLRRGREVLLFGTPVERHAGFGLEIQNPDYELFEPGEEKDSIHTGRVVPVHGRIDTLSPKALRTVLHDALAALEGPVPDPLPPEVRRRRRLLPREEALRLVHFPPPDADLAAWNAGRSPAHRRLAFEELFLLQLGLARRHKGLDAQSKGIAYQTRPDTGDLLRRVLPFRLTPAQRRVLREIVADLTSTKPMSRLLQGDVGSGKTILALLAMLIVAENGWQAVLMVPTEILAEQHHRNLSRLLEGTGHRIRLLTASVKGKERKEVLEGAASGEARLLVGTHALIQEDVAFARLGFVVVDEQHRFGVLQRARLREKGWNPDVLVMTATPIPRSLALTLYGDLDLSVLDEMPPGRLPPRTVLRDEAARPKVYEFLREQMRAGRQAFVIYPQVSETEGRDVRAATAMAERLRKKVFPEFRIGLVHGRLKAEEREEVMQAFRAREADLLVATTVVEVGVDIPTAAVMVVENAERFGLSQLHQLRGRVGRGGGESWCILMRGAEPTPEAEARLRALEQTTDGFAISERDLEIRGPGEFFGTRQSGLPEMRIANVLRDRAVLEEAREEAFRLVERGPLPPGLEGFLRDYWGERFGLIEVG